MYGFAKRRAKQYAPGSIADLRERAIGDVPEDIELHKPYVDEIKLKSPICEGGVMTRTSEVIDVWFDSGSMPFAQHHHPFENEATFAEQYPADIICEGIDQTRGWFYSLLAVSTLYNGKAPYKAVISTGHILDENGQKMSKSKGMSSILGKSLMNLVRMHSVGHCLQIALLGTANGSQKVL